MPAYGPWFPPLDELYGERTRVDGGRPLFQGDVFDPVPRLRCPLPKSEAQQPSSKMKLGPVMLMSHPCETSESEKGGQFEWRTVCLVAEDRDARITLDGEGDYYAFVLPDMKRNESVWYVDFRYPSVVHKDWLTPTNRVASLSSAGWVALQRRHIHFATRVEMHPDDIQANNIDRDGRPLHPDDL